MPKITAATGPKWIPAAVFLYLIAYNFANYISSQPYRKYVGRNRKNFYRLRAFLGRLMGGLKQIGLKLRKGRTVGGRIPRKTDR